MSQFHLINPVNGKVAKSFERGQSYDLEATRRVYVGPLSTAVILHRELFDCDEGEYAIYPVAGLFLAMTLIIPVEHYQLEACRKTFQTPVFNFGTQRQQIEEGSVISRLIAL